MSTFGCPGPGGSLGYCVVCGGSFATGVIMDLCGHPSGIVSVSINCVEPSDCFVHEKDCKELLQRTADTQDFSLLPADGPLAKALAGGDPDEQAEREVTA